MRTCLFVSVTMYLPENKKPEVKKHVSSQYYSRLRGSGSPFFKERNEAFAYLMEKILNAFLLAESEDQIGPRKNEARTETTTEMVPGIAPCYKDRETHAKGSTP